MRKITSLVALYAFAVMAASASAQTFDDLARNPDGHKGRGVYITGKVIQSLQEGDQYLLRVNITQERWGWKDTVLVAFKQTKTANRIVEGDIVDINGISAGIASYKAVLGQTIQLPSIKACSVMPHTGAKWTNANGDC